MAQSTRATNVGHDSLQQGVVGGSVVDEVILVVVAEESVDAVVNGPVGVDLLIQNRGSPRRWHPVDS